MPRLQISPKAPAPHDLSAYREAVVAADVRAADALLDRLVEDGIGPAALCDHLFIPALSDLFDIDAVSTPDERVGHHAAVAIAAGQLQRLRHAGRARREVGCASLVAPVGDQGRLLGEIAATALTVDGWTVVWPGVSLAPPEVIASARARQVELIVLTVDRPTEIPALRQCADALSTTAVECPVLAFGPPDLKEWLVGAPLAVGAVCATTRNLQAIAGGFVSDRLARPTLAQILASLGARVQAERRRRGWSQAQLATLARLDRTYVSAVERGRQNVTVGAIVKLAGALRVPISQLLVG